MSVIDGIRGYALCSQAVGGVWCREKCGDSGGTAVWFGAVTDGADK